MVGLIFVSLGLKCHMLCKLGYLGCFYLRIPWDRGAGMEASIPDSRGDLQTKGDGGGGARLDLRERERG